MEPLQEGIRIYREPAVDDGSPGVWLSSGSELVSSLRVGDTPYLTSSVVPIGDWRVPGEAEQQLLLRRDRAVVKPGGTVAVVRMPDAVLQPLRGLAGAAAATIAGAPIRTPDAEQASARALEHLHGFLESNADLAIQGIRVQAGGLRTATTHRFGERVAFIGLHVDRWHEGPYGCRDHGQLSINLAPRDRFLVFSNLPVEALAREYGDPDGGWLTIPRDFARRRGGYPLVRVRIRPGEAYLAPTENLVHDVSLEGSELADVCFTLRGRLRLPA